MAGPGDDEPLPATPSRSSASGSAGMGANEDDDGWVSQPPRDEWPATPPKGAPVATATAGSARPPSRRQAAQAARRDQARRQRDAEAEELFGPAWEKPRRYEAYPTLRTRVGLPSFSTLWIAVAALVLAGTVLFFVGPMLLGLGGKSPDTGGGATPAASVDASALPSPTLPPAPTPQVYVVVKNDNVSKIAKKFGVTIEQLLAANPQIKNLNRIKAGDADHHPGARDG
jgi:LysM repeat protein